MFLLIIQRVHDKKLGINWNRHYVHSNKRHVSKAQPSWVPAMFPPYTRCKEFTWNTYEPQDSECFHTLHSSAQWLPAIHKKNLVWRMKSSQ